MVKGMCFFLRGYMVISQRGLPSLTPMQISLCRPVFCVSLKRLHVQIQRDSKSGIGISSTKII